jgi:hypothetical protein
VIRYKFTDVSQGRIASMFRVKEQAKQGESFYLIYGVTFQNTVLSIDTALGAKTQNPEAHVSSHCL